MEKYVNDTELIPQKGSKPEIEELISQIVKDSTLIHLGKQDLNYLYREKEVLKCRIYSFPYENETRMEAILREVVEYSQVDFMRYKEYITPCLVVMEIATSRFLMASGVQSEGIDFGGVDESGILDPTAPIMPNVIDL